jgi:FtsP/CotA-like multicopper oxidase with cupredoxin domain/outer membrane protein TolC
MAANRRDFLRLGFGLTAGWMAARESAAVPAAAAPAMAGAGQADGDGAAGSAAGPAGGPGSWPPVETPDLPKLPWTLDQGVKVFQLSCEVVKSRFVPWREFNTWGFNGSCPGPTVEAMEGDRVRFVVTNRLPEPTTLHWHGLHVPHAMDGAEGISQELIPPGGRFVYEFDLRQHGTFFYHSHRPMQQMMGMVGPFIVHPRQPYQPAVDRDFAWVLQEWAALPGNPTPNTMAMEFNWLTMNGKAGPAATPALCRLGERVRLRFVNLGMEHHPMHVHGHTWVVTGTEAGRVPLAAWTPGNTELVGVAQARTMELVADNPGDWMIHCHLPHHMMNAMASRVGPLTEPGAAVPAAGRMEDGMGMPHGGHALSAAMGPSLGRTTGVDAERLTSHLAGPDRRRTGGAGPEAGAGSAGPRGAAGTAAQEPGAGTPEHRHHGPGGQLERSGGPPAPAAAVPGYPQDMLMVMDAEMARPETWGLRPGWSGGLMGMMTLLRVLHPRQHAEIAARAAAERRLSPQGSAVAARAAGGLPGAAGAAAATGMAANAAAAGTGGAAGPALPTVQLADLEARARRHNAAMAATEAALAALDAQARHAGTDAAVARQLAQTRAQLLDDRQRLTIKFRTLFFHTLHNQRRMECRERLAKVAREAAAVTDQLWNVGAADAPDRLAIENEAQVLEAALAAARVELEEMRAVLVATVGDPSLELGPLDGDLVANVPQIDPEQWRQRLLHESPPLQAARTEIAQHEEALARARREDKEAEAAAAAAALAQAHMRAEQTRITVEVSFAETYGGYRSAVQQLAMYHGGVLARAERAYEENLRKYQQMAAAYPQVLVARRNLFQLEDAALDAEQKAWSEAIDIQALLSYELPQNLAPPMAPTPGATPPGATPPAPAAPPPAGGGASGSPESPRR